MVAHRLGSLDLVVLQHAHDCLQETHSGVIVLEEDEPEMVKLMIDYLYTGTYKDDHYLSYNPALTNALLYILSDKYNIPMLRDMAAAMFSTRIQSSTDCALFLELIPLIYEKTNETDLTLREPLAKAAASRAEEFLKHNEFTSMVASIGDFGKDMMLALHRTVQASVHKGGKYECPSCDDTFDMDMTRAGDDYICPCCGYGRKTGEEWAEYYTSKWSFQCPHCDTDFKTWMHDEEYAVGKKVYCPICTASGSPYDWKIKA